MSEYVKRAMQPDEKIIYAAQLHWVIYRSGFLTLFLGTLFGYYAKQFVHYAFGDYAKTFETPVEIMAFVIILVGTFELISSFIRQISTELVVTDRRVIAKHGFISTTSYEVMMSRIEGATIEQSILGRILNYGTLMVKGTGGSISPIDHVANPYRFHAFLMDALKGVSENVVVEKRG